MYREIELKQWHKVGGGANGSAYVKNDNPDLILKLNNKPIATEDFVKAEYNMSKNVKALGISTPDVYEIVKVNGLFATILQNIKGKKSFSRLLADNPDKFEEYVKLFATRCKELHSVQCNTDIFESKKEQFHKAIDSAKFIKKYKKTLCDFVNSIPDTTNCLHGDMQVGNLIQANGKEYWIDLGRFGYGDPIFDIAHMYSTCIASGKIKIAQIFIEYITHLKYADLNKLWKIFVKEYYGITEEKELLEFNKKIEKYYILDLLVRNYYQPGLITNLVNLIMIKPRIKREFDENNN